MIDFESPLEVCGMGFFLSVFFLGSFNLAMAFVVAFFVWVSWNVFTA
jgi:hypothetical protein